MTIKQDFIHQIIGAAFIPAIGMIITGAGQFVAFASVVAAFIIKNAILRNK